MKQRIELGIKGAQPKIDYLTYYTFFSFFLKMGCRWKIIEKLTYGVHIYLK